MLKNLNVCVLNDSGNPSIQQLWIPRRLTTVVPLPNPPTPKERFHQNVGE